MRGLLVRGVRAAAWCVGFMMAVTSDTWYLICQEWVDIARAVKDCFTREKHL